ncbi:MAG: hypothetical protein LWX01_06710 [Deltaproteobacteria bacterium]|nr:hypothetical protein [Deltaproteobacteria bacterium]MDL1961378.1 hypothetical protein [Deltaproteobacteria bacterium]
MGTAIEQRPDQARFRTVVMLRKKEREKLDAMAISEGLSAAEIVRRSISAYDPQREDESIMELAVETMSQNLKEAIEQVRETRKVVAQTRAQLHAERGVGNGGN